MESGPALAIRGLRKSFATQVVLNGIDMEVARGETLAVLGRSGTGKSVLLKIIIGLLSPDAGSVHVNGEEIVGLPLDRLNRVRRRLGFLFQYAALYDSLTVEQNVMFPLLHQTTMRGNERLERAHELLKRVGMADAARKFPAQISGGMRKRVGLARALALDPDIMLYDEPTAGLDPITAGEINDLINALQEERRMSSVVVTHDLHSAREVSDRVTLLHRGDILFEGTMQQLRQTDNPFAAEFIKRSM